MTHQEGGPPLPTARHVAVPAHMDARPVVAGLLGLAEDDVHVADVRQNSARIHAETSIPVKDCVRGLVDDIATGALREVA